MCLQVDEGEYLGDALDGIRAGICCVLARVVQAGVPSVCDGGRASTRRGLKTLFLNKQISQGGKQICSGSEQSEKCHLVSNDIKI